MLQAIILAAGMGRRLARLTQSSTKCMVHLNGKRLIERTIEALERNGVTRVVLVVGFGGDEVREFVSSRYGHLDLEFVYNPDYATTNNIYSLLLAKHALVARDSLILESDVVFEDAVLANCIKASAANAAVVAKFEPWMDGTVALLSEDGHIRSLISKQDFEWSNSNRYYKTVNIYKVSRDFARESFVPFLAAYVSSRGMDQYYEEVLRLLAFIGSTRLLAVPVEDLLWYEIDDVQDLDVAEAIFTGQERKLDVFNRRYGGYWRFDQLLDYCYLVNPYFPDAALIAELRFSLAELVQHYPSGLKIQSLLASQLVDCEPGQIVVGNGASELMKGLCEQLKGPIGTTVPTFNEYLRLLPDDRMRVRQMPYPLFQPTTADLREFADSEDLQSLILVNPNNPTGHFLRYDEVKGLLAAFLAEGKTLVIDESFIDFVDGTPPHSFANGEALARWPNLVVVKSLGKSYGVAGLRLGVVMSGRRDLITAVEEKLPLWNVNALAEFFLQRIGKHRQAFEIACARLAEERRILIDRLSAIRDLRVLESQANFVMVELADGRDSTHVAQQLLTQHWILVKDLKGRPGIGRQNFLRIAVRTREDNDKFIRALEECFERTDVTEAS